jgi:predicted tellurium resistance membrane protein TerC
LVLLAFALHLTKLVTPLFSLFGTTFTGRGLFLLAGGLFLLTKATHEIHVEIDPPNKQGTATKTISRFGFVIMQIAVLDIVFSLDSILTAIGLTQNFWLMASSIIMSIIIMLFASEPVSAYIQRHPSLKMLALGFLILIATVLIADGLNFHVPRGYLYFAISFSLFIELLNLTKKKKRIT